jgi:hypothetical protein
MSTRHPIIRPHPTICRRPLVSSSPTTAMFVFPCTAVHSCSSNHFPTIAVVRGRAKVGATARPLESCASFAVDLRDSLSATATACATISSPLDRSQQCLVPNESLQFAREVAVQGFGDIMSTLNAESLSLHQHAHHTHPSQTRKLTPLAAGYRDAGFSLN